ncbi:RIP metalloprotease RseP [Clostridiisalibacter paucivorans]|uniref:RIP metalloprotease RseP n=1 Tax=Clostridiisalibacter paucivorans TaxID=408753 RepID=UPI00047E7376|nr:RIP metalloprotease RseP [Clostridiisalibacter paucivorans]
MNTAIAAIFVFFVVVLVHELGHFTVAKLVGIKVHEFSIGMGPRIGKMTKGETEYSLRILPIGGYVKMEGEDEASDDERSFNNKPPLSRILVLAAGAFMNFVLAAVVFAVISYNIGIPTIEISKANKDLPAYEAGVRTGDVIKNINGEDINDWEGLVEQINGSQSDIIKVTVNRKGEELTFDISPTYEENTQRKIIGITPVMEKSLLGSLYSGIEKTILAIGMMFQFFGMLFSKLFGGTEKIGDVMGPIGVISVVGEAAKFGFLNVLYIAGIISVNLGFFNLLPIPALDGSRIMFMFLEIIRGKAIDPEKEGLVHLVGFVLLLMLMVFVTYKDIMRLDII